MSPKMSSKSLSELQLDFISQIQSRLLESRAVTTYKYALLQAIADLCVLNSDANSDAQPHAELVITKAELAERWLSLYAGQAKPYPLQNGGTKVLLQRSRSVPGATVLTLIDDYHALSTQERARQHQALIKEIKHRLENPITRLYAGGGERDNFLYSYRRGALQLRPGIAYCFREHHALVTSLIRERWLTFVREHNSDVLTERQELSGFLFGVERRALTPYRECLLSVGDARCFYCGGRRAPSQEEPLAVDHFIPWSLYPVDLAHNFVLACQPCNSSKSNHLPSLSLLQRWLERNQSVGAQLAELCDERGLPHDLSASKRIARWAYVRHLKLEGELWQKPKSHLQGASLSELSELFKSVT